jgi:SOS-response transcriptional repressor LexA
MHTLQLKLLVLSETLNLSAMTLREIGEKIGEDHPQKVKHHLDQLFKKGLLKKDNNQIVRGSTNSDDNFYSIPIVGAANCGKALTFADETIEGYLTVSKGMVNSHADKEYLFAVRAIGNSMDNASINGKNIEPGDYLIIDSTPRSYDFYNNKYVLSIISGFNHLRHGKYKKTSYRPSKSRHCTNI